MTQILPGQLRSSELSLQSLSPSHLNLVLMHFSPLSHLNSPDLQRTKNIKDTNDLFFYSLKFNLKIEVGIQKFSKLFWNYKNFSK